MDSETLVNNNPWKRKKTEKDYFRMLPNDMIGHILSRLTKAEAARTSVLSRRWTYLWTYSHRFTCLDFDDSFVLHQLENAPSTSHFHKIFALYDERERFTRRVDQVLKSLPLTHTVESLAIRSDLGNDSHVENWVQFALQKKVKKLSLDLVYTFLGIPYEHCLVPSLLKLSTLKELRLSYVEVSGEDLEYLLSSCPLLETLAVMNSSPSLHTFKVSSHSKLKQLQLISCRFLLTLEISAANLVSFTCNVGHGMPYYDEELPSSIISIDYKHVPNLKEVCFGGAKRDVLLNNFLELTTYHHSSCLEVLKLCMIPAAWYNPNYQLPKNLVLATLHHLEFCFELMRDDEFNFFVLLMNRCPSLRTLTLKIVCDDSNYEWGDFEIKEKGAHAYNCVEEVKVIGFGGTNPEVEFIEGIINNSPNLKKLIVDPISPYDWRVTFENKIREIYDYSLTRTCARNMEPNIPSQVEFVIL